MPINLSFDSKIMNWLNNKVPSTLNHIFTNLVASNQISKVFDTFINFCFFFSFSFLKFHIPIYICVICKIQNKAYDNIPLTDEFSFKICFLKIWRNQLSKRIIPYFFTKLCSIIFFYKVMIGINLTNC